MAETVPARTRPRSRVQEKADAEDRDMRRRRRKSRQSAQAPNGAFVDAPGPLDLDNDRSYTAHRTAADEAVGFHTPAPKPRAKRSLRTKDSARPSISPSPLQKSSAQEPRPHGRRVKEHRAHRPHAHSSMDDEEYRARRAARRERRRREREAAAAAVEPIPESEEPVPEWDEPVRRATRPPRPIPIKEAEPVQPSPIAVASEPSELTAAPKETIIPPSAEAPASTGGASSSFLHVLGGLGRWKSRNSATSPDDETQKKLDAMQKKIDAQQRKDELALQKREESARKKEEALARKAALEKKREEMAQQRKRAALLKQQQRDAEKERQQQSKLERKEEALRAKQAKANEALIQAEAVQRQKALAEMDRKQRRLLAITPFEPRHPVLDHNLLTPVQRHTLLKVLVMMQMQREWLALGTPGTLGMYGFPFALSSPSQQQTSWQQKLFRKENKEPPPVPPVPTDEPLILRHLFQVHLRRFPGLRDAPLAYWQGRIQSICEAWVNSNLSTSKERGEMVLSHLLSLVATQYLGLFFARGVGVRGQHELRGPGIGDSGTEKWGVGKGWGAGTVKRGLARPYILTEQDYDLVDSLMDDDYLTLWREAGRESERIQSDWNAFKETIIEQETGLEDMVDYLSVSHVGNLPVELQNAEEWVRIHVAQVLRWLLVVSPVADGLFQFVRVAHMLFPYWAVRQALMVTNAQTMVQLLVSILFSQPAGVDSLFQRIISHSIGKQATTLQKEQIDPLRQEISEPMLVHKVEAYVRNRTAEETYKMHAESDRQGDDILTTILLSNQAPQLDDAMQDHVLAMQAAFASSPYRANLELAYPTSMRSGERASDTMPPWEASSHVKTQARTFALLKLLLRALLAKHDRTNVTKLLSSNLFVGFLKDSLTHIFYDGLRQVSKAADLGGRLGDLQKMLDDMIEMRKSSDNSEQRWIDWVTRHHEFVYFFAHEMAPVLGPIWEWCQAALDFLSLSTSDPLHPDDRRAQDIEVNLDEMLQDKRLTDEDVEHIVEELNALIQYSRWSKIRREMKYRCMFVQTRADQSQSLSDAAGELVQDVQEPNNLLRELMELEHVAQFDGRCDDVRGSERDDLPWAFFDVPDPLGQSIRAEPLSEQHRIYRPRTVLSSPSLVYTRKLQPLFRELLVAELPDWLDPELNGPPKVPPKQLAAVSKQLLRQTRAT